MARALHLRERKPRIEIGMEGEGMALLRSGLALLGPHHPGETQAEPPPIPLHHLLHLDGDLHRLTRPDVGDRGREHVRPLLLHERRLRALLLRVLVRLPRLLLLLDDAQDDAVAHLHLQRVHRRLFRQWKEIDPLHPVLGRILEDLRDLRPRNDARYPHLDGGAEDRRRLTSEVQALAVRLLSEAASCHEKKAERCQPNGSHFIYLPDAEGCPPRKTVPLCVARIKRKRDASPGWF